MSHFIITRLTLLLLVGATGILAQPKLSIDSFLLRQNKFPDNYKGIAGDPKGWRAVGHYNFTKGKADTKLSAWDTLSVYTPFQEGRMYLKIRGNKIVGRGDKKAVLKIIYVDNSTLLLESKHNSSRVRTLYRRRT